MGARLAKAALNPHWASLLTDRERLILFAMAITANDTASKNGPPAVYWGGHDYLILITFGDLPERRSIAHNTARQAVRRAIVTLRKVGAIERIGRPSPGQQARYRIALDLNQPALPVDNL